MARPFCGNWACTEVRTQLDAGASDEQIAQFLARRPEFIQAIRDARVNGESDIPGGALDEQIVSDLSNALVVVNF